MEHLLLSVLNGCAHLLWLDLGERYKSGMITFFSFLTLLAASFEFGQFLGYLLK